MERNSWDDVLSVLTRKFQSRLKKQFTDEDWLHCLYLGNSRTTFEICKDENRMKTFSCDPRSPKWNDHITETDELTDKSLIKWKRFLYHVGRARDQYSIAKIGLLPRRKERTKGRQTIFFTHLDPFNSDADEKNLLQMIRSQEITLSYSLDT